MRRTISPSAEIRRRVRLARKHFWPLRYKEGWVNRCLGVGRPSRSTYLEIGVRAGESFLLAQAEVRIGVDPCPTIPTLDEVETLAAEFGMADAVAVEAPEGAITLALPTAGTGDEHAMVAQLTRSMRLPAKSVRVEAVGDIPLLPSGKIDYKSLHSRLLDQRPPDRKPHIQHGSQGGRINHERR